MITVFDLRDALKTETPPAMLQLSEFIYRLKNDPQWEKRWQRLFRLALPLADKPTWDWVDIICMAFLEASATSEQAEEAMEKFSKAAGEANTMGVDEGAYFAFRDGRWWPDWLSPSRAWLAK